MNKTVTAIIATTVALMAILTARAIAATPINTTSGTCFDGSTWTLTLSRGGSKVVSNLVVKPTLKNATWVVNYAYIPQNQVSYQFVKSDKQGIVRAKSTFYSKDKTGVLIFTDNSGTLYCTAYGEI